MTGHSPPGREQAPGWQSEGSSKNNTDSHIVSDDRERTRDLRLGYQVGYGTGYHIGYAHGWHASDDEWQALLGVLQVVLSEPRHTELETARQPSDAPCPTRCRTCARCARHAVVHSNLRRYGTADFPGGSPW